MPSDEIEPVENSTPDLTVERVEPIAQAYIAEVRSDPGTQYLQSPRFASALWHWAQAQAKVQLLTEWVDSMSIAQAADSARGQTSALELLRKWMSTSQTWAARLGLDPLSAAKLGKDVAQGRQADAATMLSRLRAEHEAATRDSEDES
ncbi:hypothetical protein [Pseudolysinimonas sp.]|uniref:hypothetical protein n=1 Tax=Pseudolysinimonas sp. TaxID=2680009 RepID=UPI003F7FEBDE